MVANDTTSQPLRVALIIRTLSIGGAECHVVKLARNVDRSRVSLSVSLLVRSAKHVLQPQVEQAGVPVFVSPYHKNDPRLLRWLTRMLRRESIDVAHSFLWRSDATLSLTSLLSGYRPVIGSVRGGRGRSGKSARYILRDLVDRHLVFRRAIKMVANSQFGAGLLVRKGCPQEKVTVIPNGVDLARIDAIEKAPLRQWADVPPGGFIVGYVGRLVAHKGVDNILNAARLLQRAGRDDVWFVIVGDGPERERLEFLAGQLGVHENVVFTGFQVPPTGLTRNFDVALLTTTAATEHCSNSILEYMACRKPVIATNVAGNPELVLDGETGLLVEPGDPEALAQAIVQMLENPARMRQMGEQGRARIEREFRMETAAARFADLWREVAERP